MLLRLYLLLASVFAHCGGDVGIFVVYSHVILTLELFVGDLWFLSPYSRSESAHPRLMESDDVVCLACLVVQASLFLCMSELDRAGASLNAISLSLIVLVVHLTCLMVVCVSCSQPFPFLGSCSSNK